MPATLRSLLAHETFALQVVVPSAEGLDEPLLQAHSSDLVDPTPWLEPGQLLLTDGVQFARGQSAEIVDPYVDRLRARGIRVLGFATRIAHDEVPPALISACLRVGLPLIQVPQRTPFMAIIRYIADAVAVDERRRLEWSLSAQRAVARAALRPDGLNAVLAELERALECWVALYDTVGDRVLVHTRLEMPASVEASVQDAVLATLHRGNRAALRITAADGDVTLQTLGRKDNLRGVLVVGTAAPLDPAGNDLVASVIGLASIALEQSRTLDAARRRLRSGLLELLLAGVIDVAGRTATSLWGPLPRGPVRVAVLAPQLGGHALLEALELHADRHGGRMFFAERDDQVVVITRDGDTTDLLAILGRHGARAGFSAPVPWQSLEGAIEEGRRACARTTADRPVVWFETVAAEGMLGLLEASGGAGVARRMLEPLSARAEGDGGSLLHTARVWLQNNCAADPTSRSLGVHRHTLRNRIAVIEQALGIDLGRFEDRAELWSALRFVPDE